MADTNGYRVHVGDEFDVQTPEQAVAQAKRVRYGVERLNNTLWLKVMGSNGHTAPVQVHAYGDCVWDGAEIDTVLSTLTFHCDSDDEL